MPPPPSSLEQAQLLKDLIEVLFYYTKQIFIQSTLILKAAEPRDLDPCLYLFLMNVVKFLPRGVDDCRGSLNKTYSGLYTVYNNPVVTVEELIAPDAAVPEPIALKDDQVIQQVTVAGVNVPKLATAYFGITPSKINYVPAEAPYSITFSPDKPEGGSKAFLSHTVEVSSSGKSSYAHRPEVASAQSDDPIGRDPANGPPVDNRVPATSTLKRTRAFYHDSHPEVAWLSEWGPSPTEIEQQPGAPVPEDLSGPSLESSPSSPAAPSISSPDQTSAGSIDAPPDSVFSVNKPHPRPFNHFDELPTDNPPPRPNALKRSYAFYYQSHPEIFWKAAWGPQPPKDQVRSIEDHLPPWNQGRIGTSVDESHSSVTVPEDYSELTDATASVPQAGSSSQQTAIPSAPAVLSPQDSSSAYPPDLHDQSHSGNIRRGESASQPNEGLDEERSWLSTPSTYHPASLVSDDSQDQQVTRQAPEQSPSEFADIPNPPNSLPVPTSANVSRKRSCEADDFPGSPIQSQSSRLENKRSGQGSSSRFSGLKDTVRSITGAVAGIRKGSGSSDSKKRSADDSDPPEISSSPKKKRRTTKRS